MARTGPAAIPVEQLHKVVEPHSRILITHYNKLWYPPIALAEALGMKSPAGLQNWLTLGDIDNLLALAGFERIKSGKRYLFPFNIPLVEPFFNRILANLPIINRFCLVQYVVARPLPRVSEE